MSARAGYLAAAVSLVAILGMIVLTAHDRVAIPDQLANDLTRELRLAGTPVAAGSAATDCAPRLTYRYDCRVALSGSRAPATYDLRYVDLGCWHAALVGRTVRFAPRQVRGCAWH